MLELKDFIIYYANEKEQGQATHPVGNIFFRTPANEFVLIDVTGGNEFNCLKKIARCEEWMETWEDKANELELSLHAVILAPLAPLVPDSSSQEVHVVAGDEARKLLGGLDQIVELFQDREL